MESTYRMWIREKREGIRLGDLHELSRELQAALGTAKWQVFCNLLYIRMITPFLLCILFFSSTHATVQDFCVADLKSPQGPTGYSCKDANIVTADNFFFSGLNVAGNTSNAVKVAVNPVLDPQIPGLNNLGVSMARFDMDIGGVVSIHTHPHGTELQLLVQGSVVAGFISTSNKVYTKTFNSGDAFVVPKGLLHFVVNVGKTPSWGFVSFSSESPGTQQISSALFANDLPSQLVAQTTFLDPAQIKKLKDLLGGTN